MRISLPRTWKAPLLILVLVPMMVGCATQAPSPTPPPVQPTKAPPAPTATSAPTTAPAAKAAAAPAKAQSSTTGQSQFEKVNAEFQKVVEAAKKEGKVTYYTGSGEAMTRAIEEAWKKKYPEIQLETVVGRTPTLQEKMAAEQRAKAYVADLFYTTWTTTPAMEQTGYLKKFDPAQVLPALHDPSVKWSTPIVADPQGLYYYGFALSGHAIAINPNLVPPDKEPKGWSDLLDPYWTGKILLRDPAASAGMSWSVILHRLYGEDYLKKMAAQKPRISTANSADTAKLVATGEFPITIPADLEEVYNLPAGTPIKVIFPKEGINASSQSVVLLNNGPHPNAALVLANFFLAREGQEAQAKGGRPVAMSGVRLPFPQLENLDAKGIKINEPTKDELVNKQPQLAKDVRKWFGMD